MGIEFLPCLYDSGRVMPKDITLYEKWLVDEDLAVIGPQVYAILQKQKRLGEVPLFFQEKLKERFQACFYQNLFIKNQTQEILHKFEERGIDVIPLKGVLFSEKYFGHLGARPTSDIDLLVKEKDLELAIVCVQELGFRTKEEEIEGHFHTSYSKELPGSEIPLTVELHWDVLPQKSSALDIREFWQESQLVFPFEHVRTLSSYHTFYMICLHSWRHNLDSLKHYLDMIQLIATLGDGLDYDRIMKDAARHKTMKRMVRTLSVVYQECAFLGEIKDFPYKKEASYLCYEGKKGRTGSRLRRYIDFLDYQLVSYDRLDHMMHNVLKWVKGRE